MLQHSNRVKRRSANVAKRWASLSLTPASGQ